MNLDSATTDILQSLLGGRSVAALATLHEGRPFASMIPFAAMTIAGRLRLVTHVSGLSAHTRDMRATPDVCLLVTAPESAGVMPQALPRVSISAVAEFIPPDHPHAAVVKAAYLGKFPEAADLFHLGDFSLVAFEPTSARLVAGFARAMTLSAESLAAALAGSQPG
ncbi:MAG: pyridoxamine 5'-phosphate oxidase family protein [Planctomycetia bacterium]|nr:pyridoxamine 5'-phosphate oxidase family protein [Planctomycetia bacterium]